MDRFGNDRAFEAPRGAATGLRARLHRFLWNEEDGAMIIFGLMIFGLMLAVGGLSFDLMRYEAHRERLQSTLDRAVLAAASLTQSGDPTAVVLDYFAKAGMSNFIDAGDVTVTEGLNSRMVQATARIHVPLHHGNFAVFTGEGSDSNTLVAQANSTASESIGNVEISLVLDVSGSMGWYGRLTNLKSAANSFLDTIYGAAEDGSVSTSIVPYATQVNAGADLLSHWNRADSHEFSHCVNFVSSDFNSTSMPLSTTYEQSVHFDPWTSEYGSYDIGDDLPNELCETDNSRTIQTWSTNLPELKSYINSFHAGGNTSTDVGTKWGMALLDPSTRDVLTSMITTGDADSALTGRPFDYDDADSMKVLVVMTDGAHTNQYYMSDYRGDDLSFVWKHTSGSTVYYSMWWDGNNSAANTNPTGSHSYCDYWSYGSCYDWETGTNPKFWYRAWGSGGSNSYGWYSTPAGGSSAQRLTWGELWAEVPPEYFSDEILLRMGAFNSTERNAYEYAIDSYGRSTKDSRMSSICTAAKDQDVIIFTIGLEVTSSNATKLKNCASSVSHYYDVDNLDIGAAFQSIAGQINQLRLIQ